MCNGDTWSTLLWRLDSLPSDLNKLYRGMWSRLGDDEHLYKKKAAAFFNFAIAAGGFEQVHFREIHHRVQQDAPEGGRQFVRFGYLIRLSG